MPYPEPVLGPRAKAAIRLPIDGQKRRKLLVLIAAYRDAGMKRPPNGALVKRLPFLAEDRRPTAKLHSFVGALERDGWIREGSQGRYVLLFDPDGVLASERHPQDAKPQT